jgi:hypothetical protein
MKVLLVLLVSFSILSLYKYKELKEENQQLREHAAPYIEAVFLGMNKGGYRIVIRDDVINVTCKAKRWTLDDERK